MFDCAALSGSLDLGMHLLRPTGLLVRVALRTASAGPRAGAVKVALRADPGVPLVLL